MSPSRCTLNCWSPMAAPLSSRFLIVVSPAAARSAGNQSRPENRGRNKEDGHTGSGDLRKVSIVIRLSDTDFHCLVSLRWLCCITSGFNASSYSSAAAVSCCCSSRRLLCNAVASAATTEFQCEELISGRHDMPPHLRLGPLRSRCFTVPLVLLQDTPMPAFLRLQHNVTPRRQVDYWT